MKKSTAQNIHSVINRSSRNTMKPLVSIITVCRDSEKTIARTIESVLNQTYDHIQYLIIDGASSDNTMEIVKQYEPKFKGRMRWISEKDAGIYDAMNKGIGLAEGKIIGIINSDDWYENNTVEIIAHSYREHGEAVYYGILRVIENGQEVKLIANNYKFLYREVVGHPSYFVASTIYRNQGLFRLEYRFAADYELMMRFINQNVPFIQIDRILANYTQGGETTKHGLETLEEFFRIRCEYGFITKKKMVFQILKFRVLYFLKRMKMDV